MRNPTDGADAGTGYRTALKSVRHLGSAREGTEHFIRQRLTALANAVLVLVLAFVAIALSGKPYADAVAMVGSVWVAVPLSLAIISVCVHLKLGLQIVIEDYVSDEGPRILLLALNMFFATVIGAVALFAIVKILLASLVAGA